jgi:mannitol operon repressor
VTEEEDLKFFSNFLRELQAESDRGLALVGAALIDDRLRATLAAFFAETNTTDKLLEQPNAPLSTFSARTDACLALALIDQLEYSELVLIRKVRNEFAHQLHGTTFLSERIAGFCSNLQSDLPKGPGLPPPNPRFRFTHAVVGMVMRLYYRPNWVGLERRKLKVWVPKEDVTWRVSTEEPPPKDGTPILGFFAQGGFRFPRPDGS